MSTVAVLIDRLYREYLEVVDDIPSQAPISGTITDVATAVVIDDTLTPEEAARLAIGSIVEIGSELMMGLAYDGTNRTLSNLQRGFMGTAAADHTAGDMLRIAPNFPRVLLFDALADSIDSLTDLWTTATGEAIAYQDNLYLLDDPTAIEITSAWVIGTSGAWSQVQARLEPEMPIYTDGIPISTNVTPGAGSRLSVTYRKRLTRPTAEADTLAALGVDTSWIPIVLLGAAAGLMAGRELSRETTEYLTQLLEAQIPGTELGRRASVATTFMRVQAVLIDRAVRQLAVQHRPRTVMRSPW